LQLSLSSQSLADEAQQRLNEAAAIEQEIIALEARPNG